MEKVDRHAIYLGAKLWIRVNSALVLAPVIGFHPVGHQFLEVGGVSTVLPAFVGKVVNPARALEARSQIGEHVLGNLDAKGPQGGTVLIHGRLSQSRGKPRNLRPACRLYE